MGYIKNLNSELCEAGTYGNKQSNKTDELWNKRKLEEV